MRVQRVVMRDSGEESWTLLAEDHGPVESVERFLSYLASIEKSPNTVKAYAHDLKDWFIYLDARDAPKVRTRDSAPVPRGRDLTPIGLRRGRVPRRGGGSARVPGRHPRRVLARGGVAGQRASAPAGMHVGDGALDVISVDAAVLAVAHVPRVRGRPHRRAP